MKRMRVQRCIIDSLNRWHYHYPGTEKIESFEELKATYDGASEFLVGGTGEPASHLQYF